MACAFENFRKELMNSFELDSAHYLSTLGYSWNAMLGFSDLNLKLISVIEKYRLIASILKVCISMNFNMLKLAISFQNHTMLKNQHHISYT